jgi:hypothetical protein
MADKEEQQKPEGEQHTHIQSEPKEEEEEEKSTGSGGLLSKIGDPIGMSSLYPYPPLPPLPPKLCLSLQLSVVGAR